MDLLISKKNEVYLKVEGEQHLHKELSEYFCFDVPHAKFTPAFKRRVWDGKIRLYSPGTGELYVGLYDYLTQYLDDKGYDYIRDQYDETLRIPNVYNRLLLIPGDQWHCMTTTGDKERHTLTFFCSDVTGVYSPDFKMNTSSISNDQLYT